MLNYALPKKTNAELKDCDKETIIRCHIRLAYSLAKKFGRDDEYFDSAIFGLVLGTDRLDKLKHDNITGYLVCWMNRYLREVVPPSTTIEFDPQGTGNYNSVDLDDTMSNLPYLDLAIISMKNSGFTNEEVCLHLETTQWYIQKAKKRLLSILGKPSVV